MESVTVFAPGSTSNLGPGFDCLGVAVAGRGDLVTARRNGSGEVSIASVSDPRVPVDPARNTAALAAAAVLRHSLDDPTRRRVLGLELTIDKGLPLAGGLGGSAASAVAGAVAADHVLATRLPRDTLLLAALEAEEALSGRHADNVAPSLLGGAVLILALEPLQVARLDVHASLQLVLTTPEYQVETAAARALLPPDVPRGAAVGQSARLAALVLGLSRGDGELIRRSMVDAIAEPARAALLPGYAEARARGLASGALGVAVSGSGPTILALVRQGSADVVARALEEGYASRGIQARSVTGGVDNAGARVIA
jgi:homoserine kinase